MWCATIRIKHSDGWFQSLGEAYRAHDEVVPVSIHSAKLLHDGTAVLLYEFKGDADAVRAILSANETATDYEVTEIDGSVSAYIHFEPSTDTRQLLQLPEEYGYVLDTPILLHEDGGLEVTIIGPQGNISEAFKQIPDSIHTTVGRVGSYDPDRENSFSKLSDRQREVLRKAYELGYYRRPRETTLDDIAAQLECSQANVQEIIQRIENHLVSELFTASGDTETDTSPTKSIWK
ncbi:DNA-binding protein (plasmid) [Haloferax mediterranei ATCC 33500]|nr:DNA-binding protein [Haloferax mediterranei ATCC 33500]